MAFCSQQKVTEQAQVCPQKQKSKIPTMSVRKGAHKSRVRGTEGPQHTHIDLQTGFGPWPE